MGLRDRIERQIREAFRNANGEANEEGGTRINITRRVNRVVVRNIGGGHSAASAEQTAPIVQDPPAPGDHHEYDHPE
jgi:hypothetical protein